MRATAQMLPALSDVIEILAALDPMERLEAIIDYGYDLPELTDTIRQKRDAGEHIIRECQSPVFFYVDVVDGILELHVDAAREAPVARGFVAMLHAVFNGAPAQSLAAAPLDLLAAAGLSDALTLQRRHGLGAIYRTLLEAHPRTDSSRAGIAAVVLAAGISARMPGRNKLLVELRGRPLISHVVETLLEVVAERAEGSINRVVIVLGFEAGDVRNALASREPVQEALEARTLAFVANDNYSEGIAASIRAGVRAVNAMSEAGPNSARSNGYMFCLADQPLITAAEYRTIAMAFAHAVARSNRTIVVPYYGDRQGNPVVFSTEFGPKILQINGIDGCRPLLQRYRSSIVGVEVATDAVLRDVDTEDALQAIRDR